MALILSAKKEAAFPLARAWQTISEHLQTVDLNVLLTRNVQLHKRAYNKSVEIHVKDLVVLRLYVQFRVTLRCARAQKDTLAMPSLCADQNHHVSLVSKIV